MGRETGPVNGPVERMSGDYGDALSLKYNGLPGNDLATLTGFDLAVDLDQTVIDSDLRLRAAFAPAFQFQQIAQLNVRMLAQ